MTYYKINLTICIVGADLEVEALGVLEGRAPDFKNQGVSSEDSSEEELYDQS